MKEYKTPFEYRRRKAEGARRRKAGGAALVPRTPIVERLLEIQHYVSLAQVSRDTGIPLDTIRNWVYHEHIGQTGKVHHLYADRVMAYELPADATTHKQRIIGAQRIYRGLAVRGFGVEVICRMLGHKPESFKNIVCASVHVKRGFGVEAYRELVRIAGKLETQDPYDLATTRGVNVTKGKAKGQGWIDIGAWDLDTIHLEDSKPDITGQCGRMAGVFIHMREAQPLCDRCEYVTTDPHHLNKVDPYKLYEVYKLGLPHAEAAQLLGISKDLYSQYSQWLRPEERQFHTLSMVDKYTMTGYCDLCRDTVQLYTSGRPKYVCANGVKKYREEKGL